MPVPSLPLAPEELARQLSRPLASVDEVRRTLVVTGLTLVEVPDDPGLELRTRVTVTTRTDPDSQHWQVNIPVDPKDVDPDLTDAAALVVVIRANLEEWWDVKDHPQEAKIASWGRRVD